MFVVQLLKSKEILGHLVDYLVGIHFKVQQDGYTVVEQKLEENVVEFLAEGSEHLSIPDPHHQPPYRVLREEGVVGEQLSTDSVHVLVETLVLQVQLYDPLAEGPPQVGVGRQSRDIGVLAHYAQHGHSAE